MQSIWATLAVHEQFHPFGISHGITVAATIVLAVGLTWFAKRFLNERGQVILGIGLGALVASTYIVWIGSEAIEGTFRLDRHLPLHLCWFANLALPVAMARRSGVLFEVVYYWGLAAGLQAVVTPTVDAAFPQLHFFHYVLGHNGMVVALIYAAVVYDTRPTAAGIWKAFVAGNLLLAVSIPVNLLLEANYFFVCHKPPSPTLVDLMGPWPWYILVGELLALLHFVVAYVPIAIWNRLSPPRETTR